MIRLIMGQSGPFAGVPAHVKLLSGGRGPPGAKGSSPDVSTYLGGVITPVNGVLVVDVSLASTFFITLNQDVTTVAFQGWRSAPWTHRIALYFKQDAIGSRIVSGWPAGTKFPNGVVPILSILPDREDLVVAEIANSGQQMYVTLVAQNYQSV